MSISTKTGDNGFTSLWSQQRVKKDHIRVEAYGTLDELEAFLSEAKHFVTIALNKEILEQQQIMLKRIMGALATVEDTFPNPITGEDVENIEKKIEKLEQTFKIKELVILGKTIPSAKLDICRTITRRAERCIIRLANSETVSENIIIYINRFSDLLFLMARSEE